MTCLLCSFVCLVLVDFMYTPMSPDWHWQYDSPGTNYAALQGIGK